MTRVENTNTVRIKYYLQIALDSLLLIEINTISVEIKVKKKIQEIREHLLYDLSTTLMYVSSKLLGTPSCLWVNVIKF